MLTQVCNHPEIFERRDFISPLQFQIPNQPCPPGPPTEATFVNVIDHNPIFIHLPKLIVEAFMLPETSLKRRIETVSLSPFSGDMLNESMREGGGLSCLRLAGLSPSEFRYMWSAPIAHSWIAQGVWTERCVSQVCWQTGV